MPTELSRPTLLLTLYPLQLHASPFCPLCHTHCWYSTCLDSYQTTGDQTFSLLWVSYELVPEQYSVSVAECRAKTKFWPSSWTDSSKYLPVAAATLRLVKQWRSFQHDKPRWYRWINSIIALSFSVTTLSASLTNCPDKFRRNLTQQVTAYHSAANSFSKFHKPAVRDNTVIYIYIEREREREGGTRNVIPLIVHITHFYCYKSIWHLVQN